MCVGCAYLHALLYIHAWSPIFYTIPCFNICSSKPVRGTGFIAELPVMGQNKVLLMTSYNVLPSMSVAQKSDIYFGRISDDYPGTMIKGKDLFDSDFFKTDDEEVSLVYIAFAGVAECITFSLSLQ